MTLDELTDSREETLLCVHLQWIPSSDYDPRQSGEILLNYTRSFPFAAVLPVQPLTYLPTADGVEVTFLRKKTETKPANDGGIRFFVEPLAQSSAVSYAATSEQPGGGLSASQGSGTLPLTDVASSAATTDTGDNAADTARSWILTAKRNAEGQSIAKLFSEKIIIQEFLDGLTGASQKFFVRSRGDAGDNDDSSAATQHAPLVPQPRDALQVTSVYHKWMSERR
jgi:hypothetical protein